MIQKLLRLDRLTESASTAAGAVTIEFRPLAQDMIAELEQITVAGDAIGGARVSLYIDEERIENLIGSVLLGATDPGTTFQDARPWLYGLERLVVVVTGSGGDRVAAKVWQRLYVLEPDAPAPAPAPAQRAAAVATADEDE